MPPLPYVKVNVMKPQSVLPYFMNFFRIFSFILGASIFFYQLGHWNVSWINHINPQVFNSILLGITLFFSLDIVIPWILSRHRKEYFLDNYVPLCVILMGSGFLIVNGLLGLPFDIEKNKNLYIVLESIFILLMLISFMRYNRLFLSRIKSPAVALIMSFVFIICLGALLLSMPVSVEGSETLSIKEAFFMSTSATCVTGLSLIPMIELSHFGQIVILALIQIGGLGLLTFVAVFALTQRRGLGLKERVVLGEALNYQDMGKIHRLIRYIFAITLSMELIGAALLYRFMPNIHWEHGAGALEDADKLYAAVFTAISAFCNAGFSLYDDSLMHFQNSGVVNFVIASLIIVGGLGFAVIINLADLRVSQTLWARRYSWVRALSLKWEKRFGITETVRMSVQSKIMISLTLIILFASFVMFLLLEYATLREHLSTGDSVMACFFQAVTLRTAGFNTVDFASFGAATLLFSIFFMLLGGGPGGTAGGLKISTLAMMIFSVAATARGKNHVEIFKRRIPQSTLNKALVVVTVFVLGFLLVSGLLFITETFSGNPTPPIELLFEAASAYATVGLSTGITSSISSAGHVVLIFAMVAGRIGPLTVILAMGRKQKKNYAYPEENVMIG